MCELWIHQKCADISDLLFTELAKMAKAIGRINWTCKACSVSTEKLTRMYVAIDKKVTAMEKKIDQGEEERGIIKKSVEVIDAKVDKMKETAKTQTDNARKSVFSELRDRECRKSNVVIHQLPEAGEGVTNNIDRKKADEKCLEALFTALEAEIKTSDIKFMTRLGKKEDQSNHTRPLLIGFFSAQHRTQLLNNAKKLAHLDAYAEIGIVPDLTKEQRDEEETLRNEAKQLNKDMDKEEALNYEYRLVGLRGERKLIKAKKRMIHQPDDRKRKRGNRTQTRRTRLNSALPREQEEEGEEEMED